MKFNKVIAGALFSAAALGMNLPGSASAALITGTSSDFSYSFSELQAGVLLSGTVNVNVTGFDTAADEVTMVVTLTNTTAVATIGDNRWTSWGFGSAPDVEGVSISNASGAFDSVDTSKIPSLKLIEVCAFGSQNCNASDFGLAELGTTTFTLTLEYANLTTAGVNFDPFGVKYASVGATSTSVEFYTPPGNPPPPNPVPEPASLALLSLGLLGLAGAKKKWKR